MSWQEYLKAISDEDIDDWEGVIRLVKPLTECIMPALYKHKIKVGNQC